MSVQFILPLQHVNHPAFSQAQIRALMTSLPPNSTSSYTAHIHSTTCILHIQHVNTIRYLYNKFIARGSQIKQQIHCGHFRCALKTGHRNLIRNPSLTGENFLSKNEYVKVFRIKWYATQATFF